ncbi:MAG: Hsp20/alpha crystallin family protein [Pseudomonadota bacterium]
MRSRDPRTWMWAEACELLGEAERLQRQFFVPARSQTKGPTWEPPVDMLETDHSLSIVTALPGVAPDQVKVVIEGSTVIVTGVRPMPGRSRTTVIRRLEIPYGRFERRIELPPGHYEIGRRDLADGCLNLTLRKLR